MWEVISVANATPKPAVTSADTPKEAALLNGVAPKNCGIQQWAGWKRALDDELQSAGSEIPWKRLRDALVARRRACGTDITDETEEHLGNQALASIPEAYLSKEDELVRLP